MKQVIKYEAHNGRIFDDAKTCLEYEELLLNIAKAEILINKNDNYNEPCGVYNSEDNVNEFKRQFYHILYKYNPEWAKLFLDNPRGIVGRYLSDSNDMFICAINRLYGVILLLGDDNKTYGQPYFANKTRG